jgi:hypothetical protein
MKLQMVPLMFILALIYMGQYWYRINGFADVPGIEGIAAQVEQPFGKQVVVDWDTIWADNAAIPVTSTWICSVPSFCASASKCHP